MEAWVNLLRRYALCWTIGVDIPLYANWSAKNDLRNSRLSLHVHSMEDTSGNYKTK